MKYSRLTKEQLEALHDEFAKFLALQQIDKEEWNQLKTQKPEVAEQELDIFSDMVWEDVLDKAQYVEHFSKKHIFLFQFDARDIDVIMIKTTNENADFLTKEGLQWLGDNMHTDSVEIQYGAKPFGDDRNQEIFDLIQQGGILSDGVLYNQVKPIIKK